MLRFRRATLDKTESSDPWESVESEKDREKKIKKKEKERSKDKDKEKSDRSNDEGSVVQCIYFPVQLQLPKIRMK